MPTHPNRRYIPADVYDALELSALEFGGIGAGLFDVMDNSTDMVWWRAPKAPCCLYGHARGLGPEAVAALKRAKITYKANDRAVKAALGVKGKTDRRVSFATLVKRLGLVRGA